MAKDNGKAKGPSPLDLMKKYEFGMLAATLAGSKERAPYALASMEELYTSFGVDLNDPIFAGAFARASMGIRNGNISDADMLNAINHYAGQFQKSSEEATVNQIVSYAADRGYGDVPKDAKALLGKYGKKKVSDLKEDGEEAQVAKMIQVLRQQVMEGQLYGKVVSKATKNSLEALAQSED